jgi:hypothetical protein
VSGALARIAALMAILVAGGCPAPLPPGPGPAADGRFGRPSGAKHGPFLYVAGTTISQYSLGTTTPLHTLRAPLGGTSALALDPRGNLFAANGVSTSLDSITVYNAADLSLERTVEGQFVVSFAFDRNDYAYGAIGRIAVFRPGGGKRLLRLIARGTEDGVLSIAMDSAGALYGANLARSYIGVFEPSGKPGHLHYIRRMTRGITNPEDLSVDRSGNLYVADCPSCYYSSPPKPDSISIYPPGARSPQRVIKQLIKSPVAMAIDSKGFLYVANAPQRNVKDSGWVSVYAPGSTTPLRLITVGIDVPTSLAVDASDNLYVANFFAGTVTVYSPGAAALKYTIRDGVGLPLRLVIGSP